MHSLMSKWLIAALTAGALVAVMTVAPVTRADEGEDEKVPLDKVPKKVMDGVKAKHPKAKVLSAEKGDVDGTKVFEFKLKEGDKEWEVAYTPDGKFHSSEEPLKESELPAKVKAGFAKKYGDKTKIEKAERETTGEGEKAKVIYELIFEKDKAKMEAQFDPEGKFLADKKIGDKKKEEEKKDGKKDKQ